MMILSRESLSSLPAEEHAGGASRPRRFCRVFGWLTEISCSRIFSEHIAYLLCSPGESCLKTLPRSRLFWVLPACWRGRRLIGEVTDRLSSRHFKGESSVRRGSKGIKSQVTGVIFPLSPESASFLRSPRPRLPTQADPRLLRLNAHSLDVAITSAHISNPPHKVSAVTESYHGWWLNIEEPFISAFDRTPNVDLTKC